MSLKKSPLITAAEDAEKMAQSLAKADEIKQLGQPVYVYHDLSSSRVLIGALQLAERPGRRKASPGVAPTGGPFDPTGRNERTSEGGDRHHDRSRRGADRSGTAQAPLSHVRLT